jgi:hypothetical protein
MRVLAAIGAVLCLVHHSAAMAQNLDGITIVEVSDHEANALRNIITGSSSGSRSHIVTFVSARGSYAALGDGRSRACVAWAEAGSYTGSSITFGLPPSEQGLKLVNPQICQPFTLSLTGSGRVRIEAANKHGRDGPLSPLARQISYSGEHDILARVPLIAFDWGMPLFSKYDIRGVSLGPLPALQGRLKDAKMELSAVQRSSGERKLLRVITTDPSDPANPTEVGGLVASADMLEWPWDVLYSAGYRQYVQEPTLAKAFEQAVIERYGKPSRSGPGAQGRHLHWFFNLAGQQIPIGAAAPENCLSTREHWINEVDLGSFDRDIGPWGCALIMLVSHNGGGGVVSLYDVHATSGYVTALKHFAMRLEEMANARNKIEEAQGFKPKL